VKYWRYKMAILSSPTGQFLDYKDLSDEDLLDWYHNMSDDAVLDELVNRYTGLVHKAVNTITNLHYWNGYPPGLDREDLVQSGMEGLVKAIKDYDKTKGNFLGYASLRIKGHIWDLLRGHQYHEELPESTTTAKISQLAPGGVEKYFLKYRPDINDIIKFIVDSYGITKDSLGVIVSVEPLLIKLVTGSRKGSIISIDDNILPEVAQIVS